VQHVVPSEEHHDSFVLCHGWLGDRKGFWPVVTTATEVLCWKPVTSITRSEVG